MRRRIAKRFGSFVRVAFSFDRARGVSLTIPRDLSDAEIEELVEILIYEVAFDRHLRGECEAFDQEMEATN